MLGETKNPSRRWLRMSIAGMLVLVVVVVVALTSNSADTVGEKNMIVGANSDSGVQSSSMTMGTDGMDFGETDEDEPAVVDDEPEEEYGDDDDDEDYEEDAMDREGDEVPEEAADLEAVEEYLPKKVLLCDKVCKSRFKKPIKVMLCKKACKKDIGDASSPQKCYKDCKKACKKLAPKGKKKMCNKKCLFKFCPRPLKFCLNMCQKLGRKYFKQPKGINIIKCKCACIKTKKVRFRPKKCKKKCKKACKKLVKKGKKRRIFCKKDCQKLCPQI